MIVYGARAILVVVFVVAAVAKFSTRSRRDAFTDAILQLITARLRVARALAALVVAAEAASAALMASNRTVIAGFVASAAVLLAFTAVISRALRAGIETECSCFGGGASVLSANHLLRNAILVAVAVAGLIAALTAGVHPVGRDRVLAAAVGAVIGAALTRWDDLVFVVIGDADRRRAATQHVH